MPKKLDEVNVNDLDELELEMRARDQWVAELRKEMGWLKKHADVIHVRNQTEAAGRAPQNLTQGVGFELGGK